MIAKSIRANLNLSSLYIRRNFVFKGVDSNKISDVGAIAIAEAVKNSNQLSEFNICK